MTWCVLLFLSKHSGLPLRMSACVNGYMCSAEPLSKKNMSGASPLIIVWTQKISPTGKNNRTVNFITWYVLFFLWPWICLQLALNGLCSIYGAALTSSPLCLFSLALPANPRQHLKEPAGVWQQSWWTWWHEPRVTLCYSLVTHFQQG